VFEDVIYDAGPVEARDDGEPPGHRGGLEPPHVLQPPQVQLEVVALRSQRREVPIMAPVEEHPQVGLGVFARGAAVARQVGNRREAKLTRLVGGGGNRHTETVLRDGQLRQRPME